MADAEIIALIFQTLTNLGLKNFVIKVNNRKILNGLAEYACFDSSLTSDVLRLIDKLDKQSWDNVQGEMTATLGLSIEQTDNIKRFIDIKAESSLEILKKADSLMQTSEIAKQGINELTVVYRHLESLGVPSDAWKVDLSVARGLGYYTGIVFEATLTDLPSIGSVFSGGRYDDLVSRFNEQSLPATGASVGFDRLFSAMQTLGLIEESKTIAKVIGLNFDEESVVYMQKIVTEVRQNSIPADIYLGNENSLKKQLKFAADSGYFLAVIMGANELQQSNAIVKDLRTREQYQVPISDVVLKIKELL